VPEWIELLAPPDDQRKWHVHELVIAEAHEHVGSSGQAPVHGVLREYHAKL